MTSMPAPRFFKSQSALRAWFEKHHADVDEIWIGLYRTHAGDRGVVYTQARDEALCFGWIDGVRRSIDDDTWTIRFTPRKRGSIWSKVNLQRIDELFALGLVHDQGKRVHEDRHRGKAGTSYSFENRDAALDDPEIALFQNNAKAWSWFTKQAPSYQKTAAFWVRSAKKPETRAKRLSALIDDSARGERVKPLRYVRAAPVVVKPQKKQKKPKKQKK